MIYFGYERNKSTIMLVEVMKEGDGEMDEINLLNST